MGISLSGSPLGAGVIDQTGQTNALEFETVEGATGTSSTAMRRQVVVDPYSDQILRLLQSMDSSLKRIAEHLTGIPS